MNAKATISQPASGLNKKVNDLAESHQKGVDRMIAMEAKIERLKVQQEKHGDALTGIDVDAANAAIVGFRERLRELNDLAQWYILKSAVLSGLIQMARIHGGMNQIIDWYFANETVPERQWLRRQNMLMEDWYAMAMEGKSLVDNGGDAA